MVTLASRSLPVLVMAGAGVIVLLGQFGDVGVIQLLRLPELSGTLVEWSGILFAFAMLLGLLNLLLVHVRNIRTRREGWPYSAVLIGTIFVVLCAGLNGVNSSSLQWIFHNVQAPLQATLLSLIVFFIVSASSRAVRVRSAGALLMLLTAIIVLLGQMPFADRLNTELVDAQLWIISVPAIAGQRGILLGIALGTIATGLRLIFGTERDRLINKL
jgi:hypothetical protein